MLQCSHMSKQHYHSIIKVFKLQALLGTVCIVSIWLFIHDVHDVVSASLGAVLVLVTTLIYFIVAFTKSRVTSPRQALKRHQYAMIMRFITNMIGFGAIIIIYPACNFVILIVAYVITLSSYWFSLL